MYKFLFLFVISLHSVAYASKGPQILLDHVDFQLSAKQWINTRTALLSISLNATLTDADLVKARATIMEKLNKIASGEWHLTQFDRSQDGSGLEKLDVRAQARVAQKSLTQVYQNAKTVSKPGETYQISAIEFKPSFDEIQLARTELREQLYQQVRDELSRLNKAYPGQTFSLNNLLFIEGNEPPQSQTKMAYAQNVMMASGSSTPELNVGNELLMTAVVEAASTRPLPEKKT